LRRLRNALLRGKTSFGSAIRAGHSRASQRATSNFASRSGGCALDFAGKSGEIDFFRPGIAVAGDGRAALRAELFPASLILPVKRP
jgi:hypothetical protein